MSNLKHKSIVSDSWNELAEDLNKFSETNVEVKYTQTSIYDNKFYAMVYYNNIENKETQTESPEKSKNICEECGEKISDKVSVFSKKQHNKYLCFKCQKKV